MDVVSKELLKRDLFIQGLSLKWQEKALPSAATFADALHHARAAEEQDMLLGELHRGQPPDKLPSHRPFSQSQSVNGGESKKESDSRTPETRRGVRSKGVMSVIVHSTEPMSAHNVMLLPNHPVAIIDYGNEFSAASSTKFNSEDRFPGEV